MASFDVLGLDISGERRRESDQIFPSLSNHPATRVTCCAKIPVSRASWPFHRVNDTRVKGTTSFVLERMKIRCDFSKFLFSFYGEKNVYIYIYIYMERINRVFKASRCHSLLSVLIDCGEKRIALTNRQLFHYVVELFSLDLEIWQTRCTLLSFLERFLGKRIYGHQRSIILKENVGEKKEFLKNTLHCCSETVYYR